MPDQHGSGQVLVFQHVGDVLDVRVQAHLRAAQVLIGLAGLLDEFLGQKLSQRRRLGELERLFHEVFFGRRDIGGFLYQLD